MPPDRTSCGTLPRLILRVRQAQIQGIPAKSLAETLPERPGHKRQRQQGMLPDERLETQQRTRGVIQKRTCGHDGTEHGLEGRCARAHLLRARPAVGDQTERREPRGLPSAAHSQTCSCGTPGEGCREFFVQRFHISTSQKLFQKSKFKKIKCV